MLENTLMWQEIHEEPAALRRCLAANGPAVREAADLLNRRQIRHILLTARGTSDHAAIYGKYVLEMLCGIPVALASPSVLTLYHRKLDLRDWAVIGLSQSGATADAAEVLADAARQGAMTLSVTNAEHAPVADAAALHLFCSAGVERSVAATKTFTTEMCAMLMLAAEAGGHREVLRELAGMPDALEPVLADGLALQAPAARFCGMRNCFVLARGTQYPIALESALKIQETTYVSAKAFAISDFYHGPVAMVQRDTPVVLYGTRGPTAAEAQGLLRRLAGTEAEVFVFSDDPALLEKGTVSFPIRASGSDYTAPFYTAAAAQMFACCLSVAMGNDPDHPRGLQKVADVS